MTFGGMDIVNKMPVVLIKKAVSRKHTTLRFVQVARIYDPSRIFFIVANISPLFPYL
jgi:hypothetical protein